MNGIMNLDWGKFLEVFLGPFLGAFLGCIFGIASSYYWKLKDVKKLKRNIQIELFNICNKLELNVDQRNSIDYQIDVWQAAISSAIFLNVVNDLNYYLTIKDIYQKIILLSRHENTYMLDEISNDFSIIQKERTELKNLIDNCSYILKQKECKK